MTHWFPAVRFDDIDDEDVVRFDHAGKTTGDLPREDRGRPRLHRRLSTPWHTATECAIRERNCISLSGTK